MSESPSVSEGWGERWRRRAVTIPGYFLGTVLLVSALPLLLMLTLVADGLGRRSWAWSRAVLVATHYLVCECLGLWVAFVLWLASPLVARERYLAWNFALQNRWACALFAGVQLLYGLQVEKRDRQLLEGAGPVLVFIRHSSLADTLLPAVFLSSELGWRLRYLLKRELLWDPCLDVVGQRLPNVFVRRGSGEIEREMLAVSALARGLESDEGVLIYPEGTRFSPAKRERAIASLQRAGHEDLVRRASSMEHLLPPKLSGALALFDAMPEADVVVVGHVGFEGIASAGDVAGGALIGRRLRLRFWRSMVPEDPRVRPDWLYDRWAEIDAWIEETAIGGGSSS
ncbi:1-acyl-sn-glycerol-3-phosphate acyltransferase [Myxococcota bacterium]|nr:1-acyl-sn-glycerol-3-phosphate acyltransferase [Myxococcota bacterium]